MGCKLHGTRFFGKGGEAQEMNTDRQGTGMLWLMLVGVLLTLAPLRVVAQQYTGMSGLIHVPSADMDDAGEARIGVHFLNKKFTPNMGFLFEGEKYNTLCHYLSITPFSWLEVGYTCTLQKARPINNDWVELDGKPRLRGKDRYFSIKLQPLKEGKWWPAIAVGSNDPYSTGNPRGTIYEGLSSGDDSGKPQYFSNFYVAATKHFDLKGHKLGLHLAYRYWRRTYNRKWNGPVGGITYQPSFQQNLRLIVEYTGDDVNVGIDWKLWKHLLLQASLQNGKYFTGGLAFCLNLL